MTLLEIFTNLIILQYSDKPKAKATIQSLLENSLDSADLINTFNDSFDLDLAIGKQLDIIGKIVGQSRTIPFLLPKIFFGFEDTLNAGTFNKVAMFDTTQSAYTDLELVDKDYRIFIRAKIAKNFTSNTISSDDKISINQAINFLFNGQAYAIDNKNMTYTVLIEDSFVYPNLISLLGGDFLPRPAAVGIEYNTINENTFGFEDNPSAKTFNYGAIAQYINV